MKRTILRNKFTKKKSMTTPEKTTSNNEIAVSPCLGKRKKTTVKI